MDVADLPSNPRRLSPRPEETMMGISIGFVLFIACLFPMTAATDAAARDRAVTRNQPWRVCETGKPVKPASRDAGRAGSRPAAGKPASGDALKFTRMSVKDPGAGNIEAYSLLVPAGWKTEGGVQWFPDHSIQANLLMRITDPETGAAIEFLPCQNFSWQPTYSIPPGANYLGDIRWPPIEDAPEFIRTFYFNNALARLQAARIVATENLDKVADQISLATGQQARCGRVRYEYRDGGRVWEEDVYVILSYAPMRFMTRWYGGAYSFRTHQGQLDRLTPVMNTSINSLRKSPEWFGFLMYVQNLFLDRMAQGIRNAGRISDTITRNTAEIGKMYEDSYRSANESQDRIGRSYSEYIRGVETYRSPYEGRPVQLPSGYDGVWVSRSGEYILTNQPGFDPNAGSAVEWRRMGKDR
jgi:hypothetical protein